MAEYSVRYGQTLFDVAVQCYGTIEGLAGLFSDNPGININTLLDVGQVIQVSDGQVLDNARVSYFRDSRITIANFEEEERMADNDGFWVHENGDFVIDENGNKILA